MDGDIAVSREIFTASVVVPMVNFFTMVIKDRFGTPRQYIPGIVVALSLFFYLGSALLFEPRFSQQVLASSILGSFTVAAVSMGLNSAKDAIIEEPPARRRRTPKPPAPGEDQNTVTGAMWRGENRLRPREPEAETDGGNSSLIR